MKKVLLFALALSLAAVPGFSQRFAFKLGSGMSWADGGDLTKGIEGQAALMRQDYGLADSFLAPKNGVHLAGELLFYPWKVLGIGIGVGHFKLSKSSSAAFDNNYLSTTEAITPAVTVIPITLNLHLLLPLSARLKFDLAAGGGVYLTTLDWSFQADYRLLGLSGYDQYTYKAKKSGWGFQAGAGLEYQILPHLALFADGLYRIVKIEPLKGTYTNKGGGDFGDYSSTGTDASFWFFERLSKGTYFPQVAFQVDEPAVTHWTQNARLGSLDLNGFTVSMGLKYAFDLF
jgi:opacity protein-like surface antigen